VLLAEVVLVVSAGLCTVVLVGDTIEESDVEVVEELDVRV
jgi:hypothetical protein